MIYNLILGIILIFAIITIIRCIQFLIFDPDKVKMSIVVLIFGLLSLAIPMVIPGKTDQIPNLPIGVSGETKSLSPLKQIFSRDKETSFELVNETNEPKTARIKIESGAPLKDISIKRNEQDMFHVEDGGRGNTYAIYQVTIPAKYTATGSVVSADVATIMSVSEGNNTKKENKQ